VKIGSIDVEIIGHAEIDKNEEKISKKRRQIISPYSAAFRAAREG